MIDKPKYQLGGKICGKAQTWDGQAWSKDKIFICFRPIEIIKQGKAWYYQYVSASGELMRVAEKDIKYDL